MFICVFIHLVKIYGLAVRTVNLRSTGCRSKYDDICLRVNDVYIYKRLWQKVMANLCWLSRHNCISLYTPTYSSSLAWDLRPVQVWSLCGNKTRETSPNETGIARKLTNITHPLFVYLKSCLLTVYLLSLIRSLKLSMRTTSNTLRDNAASQPYSVVLEGFIIYWSKWTFIWALCRYWC